LVSGCGIRAKVEVRIPGSRSRSLIHLGREGLLAETPWPGYDPALAVDDEKVLPVQITSAVQLDESTIRSIGDRIGEKTGRKVELRSDVDPDILGGLVLRVGNNVLDASIRNRLENLRKQVARGTA